MVRVTGYRLKDVPDAEPVYRLATAILDPIQAPATELAALFHERREIARRRAHGPARPRPGEPTARRAHAP